jgi:hypothetical protein
MKAISQQRMDSKRAEWRAATSSMSCDERKQAAQRFDQAFEKIADQFCKSRRFVIDEKKLIPV